MTVNKRDTEVKPKPLDLPLVAGCDKEISLTPSVVVNETWAKLKTDSIQEMISKGDFYVDFSRLICDQF